MLGLVWAQEGGDQAGVRWEESLLERKSLRAGEGEAAVPDAGCRQDGLWEHLHLRSPFSMGRKSLPVENEPSHLGISASSGSNGCHVFRFLPSRKSENNVNSFLN